QSFRGAYMDRMSRELDVIVERFIAAPPEAVARVMFDPAREPEWMKAVESAGLEGPELREGARAWQTGRFLGKQLRWCTEVVRTAAPHLLEPRLGEGPFRGTVTYELRAKDGGSLVSIRNRGEAAGFGWMPRWLMRTAMKSAVAADLGRLRRLCEDGV